MEDKIIAYSLLSESEINYYLKNFEEEYVYQQIKQIRSALKEDNYELGKEKKFVTYLTNESTDERGVRIDFVYPLQNDKKIIIQSFIAEKEVQETTAYVIQGNALMYEYITNNYLMNSENTNKFIKNNWNGDMILSERSFERAELSWQ